MSVAPFLAGLAVGGVRYGVVKYQLQEREGIVFYSLDQIKESFHGGNKKSSLADERYAPLRSREHEYYTYAREAWNSKVVAFRDGVYGFFSTK